MESLDYIEGYIISSFLFEKVVLKYVSGLSQPSTYCILLVC